MKTKKRARYISPRITGTSALLLSLICQSEVRLNMQLNEIENMNGGDTEENFYFEF